MHRYVHMNNRRSKNIIHVKKHVVHSYELLPALLISIMSECSLLYCSHVTLETESLMRSVG